MHLLFGQIEIARADVFVRVELDLLETDDARDDVDFSMCADARLKGPRYSRICCRDARETRIPWRGPFRAAILREHIDRRHFRIRDRVRVVVAIDLAHECLTSVEVEALHLIQLRLDDVDRLGVQRRGTAGEVGLADDARLVGRVDDDEVVRRNGSQAYGISWIRLIGPGPFFYFAPARAPRRRARRFAVARAAGAVLAHI